MPYKNYEDKLKYQRNNPEKRKRWCHTYYIKNKDKIDERNRKWRIKNRERYLEIKREQAKRSYKRNKEVIVKRNIEWQRKNPEKRLTVLYKQLEKLGKPLNMNIKETRACLYAWSKCVKKRDNNICQKCGNKGNHAHHIKPKAQYPDLAFNIDNGITLCELCHKSHHIKI